MQLHPKNRAQTSDVTYLDQAARASDDVLFEFIEMHDIVIRLYVNRCEFG